MPESLGKAGMGAFAGLLAGGLATSYLSHVDPGSWANLVERVGMPFAVLLLAVVVFFVLLKVLAQPLVQSHTQLVGSLNEAAKSNSESITKLSVLAGTGMDMVKELKSVTISHQQTTMETLGRLDSTLRETRRFLKDGESKEHRSGDVGASGEVSDKA